MAKDKDYNRLIHTARWQRLRRDTLSRHGGRPRTFYKL